MLQGKGIPAVEFPALRHGELGPLLGGIADLDLSQVNYIAVHAPSKFGADDEEEIVTLLETVCRRGWHVILHPDAIHDFSLWRRLGEWLCIENTDKRKPVGRTAPELAKIFDELPEASLCFDIGHARQVDSTMTGAHFILKHCGARLRQVHVSEVNTRSKHDPLSVASILALQEVADLTPDDIPPILETPVPEGQIVLEMGRVREALPTREQMPVAI